MEKNKTDFESIAEGIGKNARSLFGKAKESLIKAVDQNNDGSLDIKDASLLAETLGNAAKKTAGIIKNNVDEYKRVYELETLQPLFADQLDNADFHISKLIRITDIDKKRAESEVCQGSIGYISTPQEFQIINIFRDKTDAFGLTFYPDTDSELYYVDPSDRDRYIALDEYFNYLKIARIDELQKIAQDLGAKHFRVTYKEQKTTFSSVAAKANANAKFSGNHLTANAEHDLSSTAVSTVEVAAEMNCPGHEPCQPTLRYLQKEQSIHNLIAMRMDATSPLSHQKYTLQLSNSSGIKEKDAVKIDAALKVLKISGNTTVTSEVRNESRRFFEYEIDF